jgi:hypothetical protein
VGKYGQESRVWRGVLYSGDSLWRPYVPIGKDRMMMIMMLMMVIMMIMITIMTITTKTTTGVVGILRKDREKDRSEEKTRKNT